MRRFVDRPVQVAVLSVMLLSVLLLTSCGGGGADPDKIAQPGGGGPPTKDYRPPSHNLTVQISPTAAGKVNSSPDGIACAPTCTASYVQGTVVTLTVTPEVGFAFTGWGGACSGTGPCSVTLNSDQSVVANFGPPPLPHSLLFR